MIKRRDSITLVDGPWLHRRRRLPFLALSPPRRYSGPLNYAPESKLGRLNAGRRDFLARLEREKHAWSILMAVSPGTN
jgi:hypothetical protein